MEEGKTDGCAECGELNRRMAAAMDPVSRAELRAVREARDAHNQDAHGSRWIQL